MGAATMGVSTERGVVGAGDLLHFSPQPVTRVRSARQRAEPGPKPRGLWLSVGEEWADWCRSEDFHVSALTHVHRIVLRPDANILRLASAFDLDAFTDEYEAGGANDWRHRIDWRRVAAAYDGILIAPYVWARRHSLLWYYGWDVASGCIWRARAVAGVEPLPSSPASGATP